MASGLVAKKIALFEPKKRSSDNVCRLKRKHAIRRKRCSRDRRLTSEPHLFSSDSDENLRLGNPNHLFQTSSRVVANSLSASCSALLDLIYNSRNQEEEQQFPPTKYDTEEPKTLLQSLPIINIKDKKILCRTSSLEEAFPTRLNIIDIDIEIRVEKQQQQQYQSNNNSSHPSSSRSSSPHSNGDAAAGDPVEEVFEPMQPIITPSCIDKIKLIARLDKSNFFGKGDNLMNNCFSNSTTTTPPSDNYNNSSSSTMSSSNSNNYFCTSCGTYNPHSDTLQEHIYENFALVPPPRPPKSKPSPIFMPSSSSPLLPLPLPLRSKQPISRMSLMDFSKISSSFDDICNETRHGHPQTIGDSSKNGENGSGLILNPPTSSTNKPSEDNNDNNKTESTISQKIKETNHVNEDKDPFYEDLYDYCLPPDCYDEDFDFIQPASVTSFVQHDKDDEVTYCDCSTVMAMAINNLNSGGTVIYSGSSSGCGTESTLRTVESPLLNSTDATNYTAEERSATFGNNQEDEKRNDDNSNTTTTHTFENDGMKGFFYLGTLLREELTESNLAKETKAVGGSSVSISPHNSTPPPPPLNRDNGVQALSNMQNNGNNVLMNGINGTKYSSSDVASKVTNDSKDKKDEDDLDKPLPHLPPPSSSNTYASSNSSDSFYSEPIYGITNQITQFKSGTSRNETNKGPGTIGPPVPDTLRRPSLLPNTHQSVISCNNVIRNEPINKRPSLGGENSIIYADSVPSPTTEPGSFGKLPPIPPSKLSTMAKSAGKKLAKKFMGIRKTSKCSMENFEQSSSSCSSSTNGHLTPVSNSPVHNNGISNNGIALLKPVQERRGGENSPQRSSPQITNNEKTSPVGAGGLPPSILKRPISRPSIPPPEPPKSQSLYGGSSNGSTQNYSIYDKSDTAPHTARQTGGGGNNNDEDDDFDDSDFYDSDSELIRNFVSQVQPIYSMEEEPLYQYYAYGISTKPDDDYQPVIPKNLGLTLDMLVPRGGQRTLWCELSEVISSGILSILSDKQKQLQEAVFEILTSEVSYLKSLDVLITVFYQNDELVGVLTEEERGFLFGNIEQVRECAHSFLAELLAKWDESWYIQEIGEIIHRNTNSRFTVYKEYCRNKPHQDKVMQRLKHTRDEFVNVIKTLEEDPRCQLLSADSFLMLPMQRITRLPLLVNAVIQRTTSVKEKTNCEEALKSLTNLVLDCNEAARESQDAEETSSILDKLDFSRGSPIRPISSLGQFLMKGDFMKNPFDQGRGGNQINWTFRKNKRTMYWLLLFSNNLLVTKKKANGKFEVLDLSSPEESHIKPLPNLEGVANDFQNFFMLHFDKKETVYFLSARTNSEIERWKSKLDSTKTTKKLRVESIFPYEAKRADELSFGVGDAIEVAQMQPDGWYYGTKVNGGQSGWFPGNYCCEQ